MELHLALLARAGAQTGRSRAPWRDNRAAFNGILWILRAGASWADVPDRYPSYQTWHRRFQHWVRSDMLRSILEVLSYTRPEEGYLDLQEAFIGGRFFPAKQGGASIRRLSRPRD